MLTIKRHIMSGRGPKSTYSIQVAGQELFKTTSGSFHAWTRKKDAQAVIASIESQGLYVTLKRLNMSQATLVNLGLVDDDLELRA